MRLHPRHKILLTHQSYAPSRAGFYFVFQAFILLATSSDITFSANSDSLQQGGLHDTNIKPFTSLPDTLVPFNDETGQVSQHASTKLSSDQPTPPLNHYYFDSHPGRHDNDDRDDGSTYSKQPDGIDYQRLISPHQVISQENSISQSALESGASSSVVDTGSNGDAQRASHQDVSPFNTHADMNNPDTVEQGSGSGWLDSVPVDRSDDASALHDLASASSASSNGPIMTPIFGQMPVHHGGDRPPVLMRRLPKLVATSGLAWQYTIPPDTFQDEDGDLRQLRSLLSMDNLADSQNRIQENPQANYPRHSNWLQYDQNSQTLYGFPTDQDTGSHEYILQVADRWNNVNNETIQITVRRHQSSEAFTHSINIGIECATQRRSSIPETLTDLVKLVSEGVFNDPNGKNMVVQAYKVANASQDMPTQQAKSAISISWSNSSLPVHPCDLSSIESIFRLLVDDRYITPTWSLQTHGNSDLGPSQILKKALGPDFTPLSVSITLKAACGRRKLTSENAIRDSNPLDTEPSVKNRIGKLHWKLGQPFAYHIPNDIFVTGDGTKITNNLSLTLHTIDGKTFDQDPSYSFLEFDQDKQTLYGLPYDITKHRGQKELLLTARHPVTNQVARETFVIDIEPQDLTTINNRAFRVSLYFFIRSNAFGPREKVQVCRRMISALDLDDLNFDHDQERPGFTVIDIQQFTTGSNSDTSATLSDSANTWRYQDKLRLVNDGDDPYFDQNNVDGTLFYKLTWTNETMGYRGECPVEVIKDDIVYAIERSMLDYTPLQDSQKHDDQQKNEFVRFYERLRSYFEPELDLIHLRFEPLGACQKALEVHDVGNAEFADISDTAGSLEHVTELPSPDSHIKSTEVVPKVKETSPINSDEYWAIVVLIILVVAIIFVVMMLFMGLHTYRINQEKRFELQLKMAQARQNSMYLSTMILADQSYPNDILGQAGSLAKPIYVDERSSRKPVILDVEKQFLANGHSSVPAYKPTSVHLTGDSVQTLPLRQNTTFSMDSTPNLKVGPSLSMANQQMFTDGGQQSMTLNRRVVGAQSQVLGRQTSMNQLSHSQSILTVTPTGPYIPQTQAAVPFVYAPMPVFYESAADISREL